MKVLAVDDEPTDLALYKALLSNYDIQVEPFLNVIEALDFLKSNKVDAVISDMNMPFYSGIDFFLELKNKQILPPIFIYVTGHWEARYKHLLYKGVDQVFHKPFSHLDVATFLQETRSQKRYGS